MCLRVEQSILAKSGFRNINIFLCFKRQGGAGWTDVELPMQRFLRFINLQNAAIREEDPKVLITAGSWSELSQNGAFNDSCECKYSIQNQFQ